MAREDGPRNLAIAKRQNGSEMFPIRAFHIAIFVHQFTPQAQWRRLHLHTQNQIQN